MTTEETKSSKAASDSSETLICFKGFDAQMRCRGYQFEVGKTFEHEGSIEICKSGFHACENPLDIFPHYPPGSSLYAEVEATGQIKRHDEDTKLVSAQLSIRGMIALSDLIGRAIKWVTDHCSPATSNHTTGDRSASSATGYSSASSATGYASASLAVGSYSSSEIKPDTAGKLLHAVAIATGYVGRARAPAGSAIVLVERDDNGAILNIRATKIGGAIKPDTWYALRDGEFVERKDEEAA